MDCACCWDGAAETRLVGTKLLRQAYQWSFDDDSKEFCLHLEPYFVLELTVNFNQTLVERSKCDQRISHIMSFLSLLLRQSRHTKNFSCLQERTQRSLMNVDFSVIDELNESVKIGERNILQDNHWMLAWRALKLTNSFRQWNWLCLKGYPETEREFMLIAVERER